MSKPDSKAWSRCEEYAAELTRMVMQQAMQRKIVEDRWYKDTLQYSGLYDGKLEDDLKKSKRSTLYVNVTKPKCATVRARLADILLPTDEANWSIEATPAPDIPGVAPSSATAPEGDEAKAARVEAAVRVRGMTRLISDALAECHYEDVIRRVLTQGIKYGNGVTKGPWPARNSGENWSRSTGADGPFWSPSMAPEAAPAFEWVNLWHFFPDMQALCMADCEFVFQYHRLNATQLASFARDGHFQKEGVAKLLGRGAGYVYEPGAGIGEYITHLRAMEGQPTEASKRSRWEVYEYHGPVPAKTLEKICAGLDEGTIWDAMDRGEGKGALETVMACVWFSEDQILKFTVNPSRTTRPPYAVFKFDDSESGLFSEGIPAMIRDPQSALNAGWRLLMDNAALAARPMFVMNRSALTPADNRWEVGGGRVFYQNYETEREPLQAMQISGLSEEIQRIIGLSRQFIDDESRLPLIAQGDPGTQTRQTAQGMTLLVTAVNIMFRDAVRSFDRDVTIPNIEALYRWFMLFHEDDSVKGDMRVKARGSSVLLVREMQAQNLLMIMNLVSSSPELQAVFKVPNLARRLLAALKVSPDETVMSDAEIEELQKMMQEQQGPSPEEIKMQIAAQQAETQLQIAEMQLKTEVIKLASQEESSIAKVQADLEKVKLANQSAERRQLAEIAVKERHGEGL